MFRMFAKRFGSGWVGIALAAVTIAGGLSIALADIPWGFTVAAALLIALIASYRLFSDQQHEITQLEDEIWSARHGTSLFVRAELLPAKVFQWSALSVDIYLANRRKDHTANIRFTLVAGDARLEANGYENDGTRLGMDLRLPSPAHFEPGHNREGYVQFPFSAAVDSTLFVVEGVRLEIRDEQTGFTVEIELPTGPDGVELIEKRGKE